METTQTVSTTLSVHPSVVFKLGSDLITDDLQALTELIKNSWDADSTAVEVRVSTKSWTTVSGDSVNASAALRVEDERSVLLRVIENLDASIASCAEPEHEKREELQSRLVKAQEKLAELPKYLQGMITVADVGCGMTRSDLERGWLTVSASAKGKLKKDGWITQDHGRTPLGDKGLGRLGAQRLGRMLDVATRTKDGPVLRCTIDWDRFDAAESLRDVAIDIVSGGEPQRVGTTVTIRGLRDTAVWADPAALQFELAELISPYSDDLGLRISVAVDGEPVDLRAFSGRVVDSAVLRYDLTYEHGSLEVEAAMHFDFLRPERAPQRERDWERLIQPDQGRSFLDDLLSRQPDLAEFGIRSGDSPQFCLFRTSVRLADEPGVEFEEVNGKLRIADPGQFTARVDVIQRRRTAALFDQRADYQKWVSASTGVRVYRDGFGVRTKADWLPLGAQWSTGSSYYTMRPENVVGYVMISAKNNSALEETSNREEFRDLPAYRNFLRLMKRWLAITDQFQSKIGRGYLDYRSAHVMLPEGVTQQSTSKEIADDIRSTIDRVQSATGDRVQIEARRRAVSSAVKRLHDDAASIDERLFADPGVSDTTRSVATQAAAMFDQLEAESTRLQQLSTDLAERRTNLDVLVDRLDEAQTQVAESWELISLGITAEVIAHEVKNLAQRLVGLSREIALYNDHQLGDSQVGEYVEHVQSTAQALTKQVARLDPSLRYVRERRTITDVGKLAERVTRAYASRLEPLGIQARVTVRDPIRVKTSEGKLAQALDNLILNAEYWVAEALRTKRVQAGSIDITVDSPFVTFQDNGPGVDQSIEALLWEPFVTRKPRGIGRGLGLFVTRQLLETEEIDISLDPDRNDAGNRFRFRLDFSRPLES